MASFGTTYTVSLGVAPTPPAPVNRQLQSYQAASVTGDYIGIALDWGPNIPQHIEPKPDKDILRSSVLWILFTRYRERVMLPEFGSEIPATVFEPNDEAQMVLIQESVREAIQLWEDRVEYLTCDCYADPDNNVIQVHVQVRDKRTDDVELLQFDLRTFVSQ